MLLEFEQLDYTVVYPWRYLLKSSLLLFEIRIINFSVLLRMYTLLKEGDFCCCSKIIMGKIELNNPKGLSSTSLLILKKTQTTGMLMG